MRRLVLGIVAALLVPVASARAATIPVQVQFDAFGPARVAALPGDQVQWTNVSDRTHTVTADDGSFGSGELPGGAVFAQAFDAPGAHPYHCTIHPSMTGEVDVTPVILYPIALAPVPAGEPVQLRGRTSDPSAPVVVERDTGSGFERVASAAPAADGTWTARVPGQATADYRARIPAGASDPQRLLVIDRRIVLTRMPHGVHVSVVPPAPNARVMLEVLRRERFGWWPTAWRRLDYLSRAQFRVGGLPARIRVSIVDRDGWTKLVTSAVLRLPAGGSALRWILDG